MAFIGTSGWAYNWNEGGSLDWYVKNSGLNAIELNSSFYRFPFPNQVKAWAKTGENLKWIVKVNQLITHKFKLDENSYAQFSRFHKLFRPLDPVIDFYLFQLPPLISPNLIDRVGRFVSRFDLHDKFALEARNMKWFTPEVYKKIKSLKITMVSIDSPIGSFVMKTSRNVYIRMHGRKSWYDYTYSERELRSTAESVRKLKPSRCYVMFNNDHSMLPNARSMRKFLNQKRL